MAIEIRPRAAELDLRLARWRADTPGCAHRNHLNNAGAALMPKPVIDAIEDHINLEGEIGGYEAENARQEAIAGAYDGIGAIVAAPARDSGVTICPSRRENSCAARAALDSCTRPTARSLGEIIRCSSTCAVHVGSTWTATSSWTTRSGSRTGSSPGRSCWASARPLVMHARSESRVVGSAPRPSPRGCAANCRPSMEYACSTVAEH